MGGGVAGMPEVDVSAKVVPQPPAVVTDGVHGFQMKRLRLGPQEEPHTLKPP